MVIVVNDGDLDLLQNLICAAHLSGVDISNTLVFTSAPETSKIVESMGLAAFYHDGFGDFPQESAEKFGNLVFRKFVRAGLFVGLWYVLHLVSTPVL